jgi:hypothetical protein
LVPVPVGSKRGERAWRRSLPVRGGFPDQERPDEETNIPGEETPAGTGPRSGGEVVWFVLPEEVRPNGVQSICIDSILLLFYRVLMFRTETILVCSLLDSMNDAFRTKR